MWAARQSNCSLPPQRPTFAHENILCPTILPSAPAGHERAVQFLRRWLHQFIQELAADPSRDFVKVNLAYVIAARQSREYQEDAGYRYVVEAMVRQLLDKEGQIRELSERADAALQRVSALRRNRKERHTQDAILEYTVGKRHPHLLKILRN